MTTAIGAPLRKWAVCLLLCSISPCALAQSTDSTTAVESILGATASSARSSTLTTAPSTKLSFSSATTSADSTCPFRTINYITHTLPQQCLRTGWSAPSSSTVANALDEVIVTGVPEVVIPWARQEPTENEAGASGQPEGTRSSAGSHAKDSDVADATPPSASSGTSAEPELETDSPFDNANFLSFEEWKKKNLERVGQSPDNVGQARGTSDQRNRRRPVNVNALDSLGEEGEIEIDFSGFGSPSEDQSVPDKSLSDAQYEVAATTDEEDKAAPSSWALSKDAGKTCKERFNYASFDCAATVLKTNPKAKSTSSILVENKDSYMLNECSAENKFIIVELCEDILVDTIVLANYEFFSSMFRHFRISVSDRYPVKLDRWRVLATFEARNSREIQPFLITEPQIWARYLRIEFLTHYGNEFYCPMSLLRVHGTTMMEQFRREEEQARGDDDFAGPIDEVAEGSVQTALVIEKDSGVPIEQIVNISEKDVEPVKEGSVQTDNSSQSVETSNDDVFSEDGSSSKRGGEQPRHLHEVASTNATDSTAQVIPPGDQGENASVPLDFVEGGTRNTSSTFQGAVPEPSSSSSIPADSSKPSTSSSSHHTDGSKSTSSQRTDTKPSTHTNSGSASHVASDRSASYNTSSSSQPPIQTRPSGQTQSNTPPTQESFFKSISKRLQYLEANSTLSLQYIEEQSRILRDAFMKVEKKQLQKTEKFLDHLNNTVMHELKSYRNLYDQLWQSTILELEGMKERQRAEIGEIGARLSMVADELVWQKRMAVVQSTLLLLCLGLVLFVRSGTLGSQSDVPIVQQLGNTYSSFFETPSHSPEDGRRARRRRTFRNMWRSDTSAALSDPGDVVNAVSDAETEGRRSPVQVAFSPPTPATPGESPMRGEEPSPEESDVIEMNKQDNGLLTPTEEGVDALDEQAKRLEVLETQSGPATPRGSRDSRPSWEEVDRAVDMLKVEEMGNGEPLERKMARNNGKYLRSPLQRAMSYDGAATDSPATEADDEKLFDEGD